MSAILPTWSGSCGCQSGTLSNVETLLTGITGYTGGGTTNIDGLITANQPVISTVIQVIINGMEQHYQLQALNIISNPPNGVSIIEPLDYTSANPKLWIQIS